MELDPLQPSAAAAGAPSIMSDSASSTEVDEEDDAGGEGEARVAVPLTLPATWAFSQRRAGQGSAATQSSPVRRRLRHAIRVHYSSRTATPPRGFPNFVLRAPAAAQPSSSTEASESDEEEPAGVAPAPPAHPRLDGPGENAAPDAAADGPREGGDDGAPAAQPPPAVPTFQSEEGDGNTCSICFEAWTAVGDHRVAALRCGHLFGFTCIQRWLASQRAAAKCPQCNKKAKRSDIVMLYTPKLKAVDNSHHESLKRALEQEQSLRRKAEFESAHCKLRLQMITSKYGQAQQELQEIRSQMAQGGGAASAAVPGSSSSSSHLTAPYEYYSAVVVSSNGGCRVLAHCESLNCLLVSQPSASAVLLPGWGVKKVSLHNSRHSQYVPIHSAHIRALSFNRQNGGMLLSASLDSTLKITSMQSNAVVQTYNAGKPVWSCCWCLDKPNYVYAGLNNGSVLLYDIRDTSTHVQELQPLRSRAPVVSLCYIPRAASNAFPCGGLIAGTLEGGVFWEQLDENTYKPHSLPLEAGVCTGIQVETESRHCLVTYRAGRLHPMVRCVLMALTRTPQQDAGEPPGCSCSPVQTFSVGPACKLLTKNAVFVGPHGSGTLVCAGNETTHSTMVWEASSGALLQVIPSDLPVLDISPFAVNGVHFLGTLTEKMLKFYKWK
ncbi:E3 ubiquitin-protein ligase RFWD3 isoform X1 [Syngnathus typhle]|uniref:E3 ubiquitin-protein ligase RFWD3 isoform X1 n=1 Tax=Syngnathus typhle TaxID=161592 RepID=UPI002A6ADE39|nr:E3 ubiquitin-protein ligase RFWD3 isoform X1 [Syngnathus typhle]XP_061139467.1 E3 ubiquitin-protein ligase RFWD3 isoform X1 [Syngnathus typhle]XP_061139468.1 E3 ubiquitin-protein ligase RFWD3 isoform X1 [Syngnathus typhle]XP_061139470.1 E3 ubiquitin-protein ligase RFWD3 isoform X1 [Syngnathus typhle]XP_061139471.1 E3 ubiquitin-protein ligase RFWD3 isoform X1 [Syngnathus typhle]